MSECCHKNNNKQIQTFKSLQQVIIVSDTQKKFLKSAKELYLKLNKVG